MNGAEALVRTHVEAGVTVCFANPGTTEMPLVAALDAVPGMRAVLGLFEGVCTGAADGYGRMTGGPAATLLHLGPGFANGIANLHNARRARTPVVNWIGDQATWHRAADAPLSSDIESLARPVSAWVHASKASESLAADGAAAIEAASGPPGQVATLVIPADVQWGAAGPAVAVRPAREPTAVASQAVSDAGAALLAGSPCVLLLGGAGLSEPALRAAGAVAAASGCRVVTETFFARQERGAGIPAPERLPYFPEQALQVLGGTRQLILAGALSPVAFFGYPDGASSLVPEGCDTLTLAAPGEDVVGALTELAASLGDEAPAVEARPRPEAPDAGPLDLAALGRALTALQPEGAVVVDEGATSGLAYAAMSTAAPPHSVLALTGGAIGQGLPCAAGAAIACPDRKVIAFQADGSGMYTLQALWTMAREGLDVVAVVCANRRYRILQAELARAGIAEPGPKAASLTDLTHPPLDWVSLARGMGVGAVSADDAAGFSSALARAFAEPGPALIEAVLP